MESIQIWESPPSIKLVASGTHGTQQRRLRWHRHDFYELGFVLFGSCDWRLKSKRLRLTAGQAVLLKPGILHAEETPPETEAGLAWLGFDFDGNPPSWAGRMVSLAEDFTEVSSCFHSIYREHHRTDRWTQARIGLSLQTILLLLSRQAAPRRPDMTGSSALNPRQTSCVESAAHYFRTNLRDPMSIAQVAAYHSLCPAHFSTLFKRHHRVSPRDFARQAKLQQVSRLLLDTTLTTKEIAADCGFVDAAHLCKSFKQACGITPRAYRNRGPARQSALPVRA